MVICYAFVAMAFLEGLVEKPFILCRYVGYSLKEIWYVVLRCMWVTILSVPLPYLVWREVDTFQPIGFTFVCLAAVVSVFIAGSFVGMTGYERLEVWGLLQNKLNKRWERSRYLVRACVSFLLVYV